MATLSEIPKHYELLGLAGRNSSQHNGDLHNTAPQADSLAIINRGAEGFNRDKSRPAKPKMQEKRVLIRMLFSCIFLVTGGSMGGV